ncbi:hypothetical protein RAC89_22350 [Paenibacillus sp. GD4]|uniref:hypothetical protein n=1 Tax=Paenibacillus sp. GD4 TaxID=3068890 RepID=UPI002796AAD7|nr:hypothetical protein [Paenibacillus sp. GD4]MDQ1913140.1 hypothetical protein [Paenibacillus sp. GD4]
MSTIICRLRFFPVGIALLLLSACGLENEQSAAAYGQLLQRSIQALNEKDQFAFQGMTQVVSQGVTVQAGRSFEGYVVGKDRLYIREGLNAGKTAQSSALKQPVLTFRRISDEWAPAGEPMGVISETYRQWNPVTKLEELANLQKTVKLDHEQPKRSNEQVLRIEISEKDMTTLVASGLQAQFAQLSLERQLEQLRGRGVARAELGQAEAELRQVLSRSEASLKEMLGSLKAQGIYTLWVDRTTKLPRRLTTVSELSYLQDGNQRTETARAEYDFKDYDKEHISGTIGTAP